MVLPPQNAISLCSGNGGLELGLQLSEPDCHCRCFVEFEPHAQAVLVGNMDGGPLDDVDTGCDGMGGADLHAASLGSQAGRDGYARPFGPAAVWDDVRTFVGDGWRGHIDLISAGYPCQPFSAAGKRVGSDDPRHLWPDVARICAEVQPEWIFLENVAGHISLGLETVLRDLWDMGYTPAAGLFSSQETGGAHERQRVFIVAHRTRKRSGEPDDAAGTISRTDARRGAGGRSLRRDVDVENAISTGAGRREPHASQQGRDAVDGRGEMLRRGDGAARTDRPASDGESSSGDVDHAAGARRDAARIGSGADGKGRERLSGEGCHDMAHAKCDAGHEGGRGYRGYQKTSKTRQTNFSGAYVPTISPPGPADSAAWAHVIAADPSRAPATALRDLIHRARDLAAMVEEGRVAETQAQSDLRRMADALAYRPRQLRGLGNGVDPLVAGYAWRTLSAAHGLRSVDLEAAADAI